MLTRRIDVEAPDLTIDRKLVAAAKRVCVVLASLAVAIGGLDLLHAGSVQAAVEFAHRPYAALATLRDGLGDLAVPVRRRDELSARVVVSIPPAPVAATPEVTAMIRALTDSPVSQLDATRRRDAIEAAMAAPEPAESLQLASLAPPLPAGAPPSEAAATAPRVDLPAPAKLPPIFAMLPPPAPGVPPPSPMERLHLDGKPLARAERCLANAIYFEARDQPYKGQVAVAQVVMNRVFSGFYPQDVCGVVYQNADRHLACQFTFACDGKRKVINERGAWARANRIAKETLAGKLYEPAVGTATHYHALYVHPVWVREMRKLVRYGIHSFYRPIAWGNGADEPVWSKLAMKVKKKN